eukprot:GHRR01010516.1.p1 GENE.GHRR01010516.1~~GHRR01010516.1.p1  ORF type:complete len:154 (-),score=20.70 GHRR01010516.1:612-1073(-)
MAATSGCDVYSLSNAASPLPMLAFASALTGSGPTYTSNKAFTSAGDAMLPTCLPSILATSSPLCRVANAISVPFLKLTPSNSLVKASRVLGGSLALSSAGFNRSSSALENWLRLSEPKEMTSRRLFSKCGLSNNSSNTFWFASNLSADVPLYL